MQETMNKQPEILDTDSDVSNITVLEQKPEVRCDEPDKMETVAETNDNKPQEQNIRVRYFFHISSIGKVGYQPCDSVYSLRVLLVSKSTFLGSKSNRRVVNFM